MYTSGHTPTVDMRVVGYLLRHGCLSCGVPISLVLQCEVEITCKEALITLRVTTRLNAYIHDQYKAGILTYLHYKATRSTYIQRRP